MVFNNGGKADMVNVRAERYTEMSTVWTVAVFANLCNKPLETDYVTPRKRSSKCVTREDSEINVLATIDPRISPRDIARGRGTTQVSVLFYVIYNSVICFIRIISLPISLSLSLSLSLFFFFGILSTCQRQRHGRLARWIKWRACDVGEAKKGLENELWRRWSNRRVWEWALTKASVQVHNRTDRPTIKFTLTPT